MKRSHVVYDSISTGIVSVRGSVTSDSIVSNALILQGTSADEGFIITTPHDEHLDILFGCQSNSLVDVSLVIHCGVPLEQCILTVPRFASSGLDTTALGTVTYNADGDLCPITFDDLATVLEIEGGDVTPAAVVEAIRCQDIVLDSLIVQSSIAMGPCPVTSMNMMSIETGDVLTQVGDIPNVISFQTVTSTSQDDPLWVFIPSSDFAYVVTLHVSGISVSSTTGILSGRFGGSATYSVQSGSIPAVGLLQENYIATDDFEDLIILPEIVGTSVVFNIPPIDTTNNTVSFSTRITVERALLPSIA